MSRTLLSTQNWLAPCASSHPFRGAVLWAAVPRGGSLRSLTPGYIPRTPPACERSLKACAESSPGLSEAIPGVLSQLCLSHPGGVRGQFGRLVIRGPEIQGLQGSYGFVSGL